MSPFPPIGQLTYLLTLPPYGFFWFQLSQEADGPSWRKAPPEQVQDMVTMVVRRDLQELIDQPKLADTMSKEVLPGYLTMRRWFGSKGQMLNHASLVSATPLPFASNILLGELEADIGGRMDTYLLPLAVSWDDSLPTALAQQLAMARLRQGRRVGFLTDGFAHESFARAVLRGLCERATISGRTGTLEFIGTDQLDCLTITDELPVHWLSAEQSNSSLIVGDLAMVKLIRHIFPGIHPEVEMTRYLTGIGYQNTAQLLGEVARTSPDGTRHTLIIVQKAIRNQGDAWNWMLGNLRRSIDEIVVTGAENDAAEDHFKPLIAFSAAIGTRLGELHVALAKDTDEEAFKPEWATKDDVVASRRTVTEQIGQSLTILEGAVGGLEGELAETAKSLIARRDELIDHASRLTEATKGTLKTRHHGDFHLGQILVAESDAYIIDFEGEPTRTLGERRAKTNPLRDVAGLLRSLSYLAAAADMDREVVSEVDDIRHRQLITRFIELAEPAFLQAYFTAVEASDALMQSNESREEVLDLFLLEKAAYEVAYEVRSRPHWLPLPLAGFSAIASRLLASLPENDR
jgi:maltose alpha-D-glucosyltransferase/alpha-amylase